MVFQLLDIYVEQICFNDSARIQILLLELVIQGALRVWQHWVYSYPSTACLFCFCRVYRPAGARRLSHRRHSVRVARPHAPLTAADHNLCNFTQRYEK